MSLIKNRYLRWLSTMINNHFLSVSGFCDSAA